MRKIDADAAHAQDNVLPLNRLSRRRAASGRKRTSKAKAGVRAKAQAADDEDVRQHRIGGNHPPEPIEPSQKRGPGRPRGSKNKPRELSPDSPFLTVAMYCRQRGISEATFYQRHRADLDVVKSDHGVLITKTSAAERDRRYTQPARRKADEQPAAS